VYAKEAFEAESSFLLFCEEKVFLSLKNAVEEECRERTPQGTKSNVRS